MSEEKTRKIDVDKFIFTKLYEEFSSIEKQIGEKEIELNAIKENTKNMRLQLQVLERKQELAEEEIATLRENKVSLKNRHEEMKAIVKI